MFQVEQLNVSRQRKKIAYRFPALLRAAETLETLVDSCGVVVGEFLTFFYGAQCIQIAPIAHAEIRLAGVIEVEGGEAKPHIGGCIYLKRIV